MKEKLEQLLREYRESANMWREAVRERPERSDSERCYGRAEGMEAAAYQLATMLKEEG